MNNSIYKLLGLLLFSLCSIITKAQINAQLLGRYSIGTYNSNGGVAEISAYDPSTKRMYVVNGPDTSFRIVNMANPANPVLISTVSVKPYGIDVTSIATNKKGLVAIAVIDSNGKTNASSIVFLNANGNFISKVKAGANTDHIIFTSDGKKLLCANEGEPNNGYTIDPEGSISIIDVSVGAAALTQANVQTAGFTAFNSPASINPNIRITGRIQSGGTFLRNSTVAEDLEPEYIAISEDNSTAWVTCQENNALAVIDINTATVTSLLPLGFKNHNLTGNGLDASDRLSSSIPGVINIRNLPVFGMYQPDGISSYSVGGQNYLVTANEGDARADWGAANNEEVRVNNATFVLDTVKFGGAANVAFLKADSILGRLNISNRWGDFNNDGKFDSIFTFGARSFSIWNGATGALVWDSKDDFEQRTAAMFPNNFNAGHTTNALDDRSDNKGPEPESVTIGKILDSTYAFVGLERIGGFMVYNITNPNSPYFVQYINTRNFSVTPNQANLATVGDLGPEGIVFIPRNESPNGKDLILLSNEVSGTVAIFQINSRSAFQMQVLHSSDMESGLAAVTDAPNFAAVVDELEERHVNTLILSSGDNVLPGPFMSSGEDASLQTPLRNTASSYYAGTQALRAAIGRPDIAIMNAIGYNASAMGNHEFDLGTSELNSQIGVDIRSNGADKRWIGAQFPFVSCNLNFSNDVNLNYLYTNQILRDTAFRTPVAISANAQKRGIAPSVIIERSGERIGIVGATTQVLAAISSPGATSVTGGPVDNMPLLASIIQPVVDSLRALGINKIVLLSHLQQLANEKALAPLLRDVDIIISGGNHAFTADGNDRLTPGHVATEKYPIMTTNNNGEPLAILNTTSEWKYVGRFVCDFDTAGVLLPNLLDSVVNGAYVSDTAMVTSLWGTYSAAFAPGTKGANVRTLASAIGSVIIAKDGNKFGKSNVFLEGRRNLVRTEETNFGNLTADANLWYARQYDNQVRISIKNGGGIRSAIGFVNAVGSNVILEPTQANISAGKSRGDISQLDIENSLRFNNGLVIGSVNAAGLKRIMEHGISATVPGATPGQFPQVGGMQFSYDTTRARGSEIISLVVTDSALNRIDTIVRNGLLVGDTTRTFKLVTLNFLFTGGDSYPFPANATNRVNLDTAVKNSGLATFAAIGSEQDAFAEYMGTFHNTNPFNVRDTTLISDRRIQQLNARLDAIFPETNPAITISQARAISAPNMVRVRGIVSRAWGRFIYIQDGNAGIGVRQVSGAMVNAITSGALKEGDSVEVIAPRNDFNNYQQIQLASGNYTNTNTIIVLASNKNITPITLTIKQINQNGEQFESRLVRVVGLKTNAIGTTFQSSSNNTVWDGTSIGDTTILRVLASQDTEIEDAPGLSIPKGEFIFEGILAQFCSSPTSGCANGYQIYGIRKKDIIEMPLTAFNLLNPATNAKVTTDSLSAAPIQINWTKSNNIISYKWMLTTEAGNFTTPLLTLLSNNAGVDTLLTLTSGGVDAILASLNIAKGDSVKTKWTVFAYKGTSDSLQATQVFNLTLVRNKPALNDFSLIAPSNNSKVEVAEASNALVNINWNKSTNATNYKWFATAPNGSFSAPLLRLNSNNNGTDSVLTLTSGTIDNVLSTLGIKRNDSIALKWTVYAYLNNDSLKANQDWNITLVRKRILGAFNLTAPSNNARVEVVQNSASTVTISWSGANAATKYIWKATTLNGNFNNPLLNLNSDNSGTNNNLTLTSGAIDAILATNGIKRGDSITLQWTVYAFETTDSLKATETFNITLIRKRILGSFNLSNPINNARLVVTPNSTSPIIINWTAAANAVTYKWKGATLTGNFTNPLLNLASDNAGADAKLTLTHNALDAVLASNGIAKGDSIKLQWTVYAFETTDSLKANETFNITLVRGAGVGVNNIDFKNNFNVYPNPTQTELNIKSNDLIGTLDVKLYSITGKLLINENMEASTNNKIDVSHLQDGVYMLSIEGKNGKTATIKVVVAH
jgi:2',3'-cyclic-nucleotide 2'-phosphodiesterase (5'-nucleotidase family)